MYLEINLVETITIQPCDFARVQKTIHQKLNDKINTCTKEHGYVIKILSTEPLQRAAFISRTSGACVIPVHYKALTLIPKNGDVYDAHVLHLYPEAVFTTFALSSLKIHIIVPMVKEEWKLSVPYNDVVQGECSDGRILKVGDPVQVRIIDTRYVKYQYQCIGELV